MEEVINYGEAGNSKKTKRIVAIVAVLVVLALIIGALFYLDIFTPAKVKVSKAIWNTLNEDTLYPVISKTYEITDTDTYSVEATVSTTVEDYAVDINMNAAVDCANGKMSADGYVGVGGLLSEATKIYYDDTKLRIKLPELTDLVFEYNYNKDNEGLLAEMMDEADDFSEKEFNSYLISTSVLMKEKDRISKLYNGKLAEIYDKAVVNRIDSREFDIDGKKVKAVGYTLRLDRNDIEELLNLQEETFKKVYSAAISEAYDSMDTLPLESIIGDFTKDDIVDMLSDEIVDNTNMDINIYIYDKKVAALEVESLNLNMSIYLNGGSNRTSNMVVELKEGNKKASETIKRTSSMSGSKETGTIEFEDMQLNYEYDTESGEYSVNVSELEEFIIDFNGEYLIVDDDSTIKFKFKTKLDDSSIQLDGKLKGGAEVTPIEGESFDIGEAGLMDYLGLLAELKDKLGFLSMIFQ